MTAETKSPAVTLTESGLPPLYIAADHDAIGAQKWFFGLLRAELLLLALGALVGLFATLPTFLSFIPSIKISPFTFVGIQIPALPGADLVAAALIILALALRVWRFRAHPEVRWYEARAVAESAKSVAWRYAVGGRPFDLSKDEKTVEALARQRFGEILTVTPTYQPVKRAIDAEQITSAMSDLRKQPAEVRHEAYRDGRIVNQRRWYEGKAELNRRLARRANAVVIGLEVLAVAAALVQALQFAPANTQAVVTALIGGVIAWTQAKRYQDLSASYRLTAKETGKLEATFPANPSEAGWAQFVDSAEEAFSREHNLWIATRDVEVPSR